MANIESISLHDIYCEIQAELEACDLESDFNEMASDLSRQYDWPLKLVKAVGKGLLKIDRAESADFIRTYLGEVELGSVEYESRAIWLEGFLGVSRRSLGATLAHRKIAKIEIKPKKVEGPSLNAVTPAVEKTQKATEVVLSDHDKLDIFRYLADSTSAEDRKKRNAEVAELYDIKPKSVPAVVANITRRIDEISARVVQHEEPLPVEPQLEVELNGLEASTIREEVPLYDAAGSVAESSDGAHIEYDNEVKNKWRAAVAETINEAIPLHKRAKMKVLCLPGKEWVEVTQIYLALGFKPENIYGVEREYSVREDFEAKAESLGCNPYFGTLDAFLDQNQDSFDFVSLDFLGPLGTDKERIISKLKLSSREAYVLINHMAQRESRETQTSFQIQDELTAKMEISWDEFANPERAEHKKKSLGESEFALDKERNDASQRYIYDALMEAGKLENTHQHEKLVEVTRGLWNAGELSDSLNDLVLDRGFASDTDYESLSLGFFSEILPEQIFRERIAQCCDDVSFSSLLFQFKIQKFLESLFEETEIKGLDEDWVILIVSGLLRSFFMHSGNSVQILEAWDYRARRNRFNSSLMKIERSETIVKALDNKGLKRFIDFCLRVGEQMLVDDEFGLIRNDSKLTVEGKKSGDTIRMNGSLVPGVTKFLELGYVFFKPVSRVCIK